MTEQTFLTPHHAATMIGVDVSTIRRWVKTGALEGHRVGPRLLRINRDAVLALVGAR